MFETFTTYSDISDSGLDEITTHFVQSHPYSGKCSLRSAGLHIQQARVQDVLTVEQWTGDFDWPFMDKDTVCACQTVCGI